MAFVSPVLRSQAGPRRDGPDSNLSPLAGIVVRDTVRTKRGSTGKGVRLRRWSPGALRTMTEASAPNRAVDAHA